MMGGASRHQLLLFDGCGEGERRKGVRFPVNTDQPVLSVTLLQQQGVVFLLKCKVLLSFVGRGFFSCVSVFFSLDLSKVVTSEMSGLSLIVARSGGAKAKAGQRRAN